MRKHLLATVVLAITSISLVLVAVAQTGSGTVTLSLGTYTEINVLDNSITVQFTPSSSNVIAWFAFNINDFLQANEGSSNTNVTLSVTGYTIDVKPRAYPTGMSNPILYFMLDQTATSMPTGLYFTSSIQAVSYTSQTQVVSLPASLDVNGDGTAESCQTTPTLTAQADIVNIALYYDSTSSSVSKPSTSEYINIAITSCSDAAGTTYTVILAKTTTNVDDFNYTDASGAFNAAEADFALDATLTPYAEHNVLTLTFTTLPNQVTMDFVVMQIDTVNNIVSLAPAELLIYDGSATNVQIFGIIELPVGAPRGEYQFTVNLAVEAAST